MSITQFDYQLFQAINGLAGRSFWLDGIMKFLSLDGEYLFYLGVIVYWFTRTSQNRRMVVEALASACVALGIGSILSSLFYRDRPFVAHSVHLLIQHAANASFPSDHATGAFVIASAIWMNRRKDGRIWLILAAGISLSRVWTGVHYPMDIVSGAILGMLSAVVVHKCLNSFAFLHNGMTGGIGLYERIEHKVWPKRQSVSEEHGKR